MPPDLPSFDLVVATVSRIEELEHLLDSLESQAHKSFRVLVVDQNADDRLEEVFADRRLDLLRLRSERGLSRARNVALPHLQADLIGFPDDDCRYPEDLLERVGRRLVEQPALDGLTGRSVDPDGRTGSSWKRDRAILTDTNLWNRAISYSIFLRREVVERVGPFDERLGLGSGESWSSGEEIDFLIRAVKSGARIEYDPSITVTHRLGRDDSATGFRDGASVGYLLRKHRYPLSTIARMVVRPLGGIVASVARRDPDRAKYYAATLRGRVVGYRRRTSSSKSAA
jgi:GT2 family glycosyltransferase